MQQLVQAGCIQPAATKKSQALIASIKNQCVSDEFCYPVPNLPSLPPHLDDIAFKRTSIYKNREVIKQTVCKTSLAALAINALPFCTAIGQSTKEVRATNVICHSAAKNVSLCYDKCDIFPEETALSLVCNDTRSFIKQLFISAAKAGNFSLSRYDLFHGHFVWNEMSQSLLLLLHAKEYPMYDAHSFPINLGYCQHSSDVSAASMHKRNALLLLDHARVTGGIIDTSNTSPYAGLTTSHFIHTMPEEVLGVPLLDVYFVQPIVPSVPSSYSVLLFPRACNVTNRRFYETIELHVPSR